MTAGVYRRRRSYEEASWVKFGEEGRHVGILADERHEVRESPTGSKVAIMTAMCAKRDRREEMCMTVLLWNLSRLTRRWVDATTRKG